MTTKRSGLNAVDPRVSERMRKVATRGTGPEKRVMSIARKLNLKYTTRTQDFPGKPDLILLDLDVAIFVHGCFWHGCKTCFVVPKTNTDWWLRKIDETRRRDRRKSAHLRALGYSVVTFWEHDSKSRVERRIRSILASRL